MAPKELLPLIQQLKDWRHAHGFSQYEAAQVLRDAGIPAVESEHSAKGANGINSEASSGFMPDCDLALCEARPAYAEG